MAEPKKTTTQPLSGQDDEIKRLREENMRLRQELEDRSGEISESMHGREASYGMSEGERQELELRGKTVSPFTGETRTKSTKTDDKA